MSVATSTAIAIGVAAASTAGTIVAAKIGSNAQTDAAKTQADASKSATQMQTEAANKALDFQKQIYSRQQGQVSPYIGYGQGALSMLGAGLGVTPTAQPPVPDFGAAGAAAAGGTPAPGSVSPTTRSRVTGKLVTLQAPNGQIGQVPEEQAQHYMQQGAKPLTDSSVS